MKHVALSVSVLGLTLASATAAAWWGGYPPYYAAPALSPQQVHAMAERQREAAIERMEAHRQAMDAQMPVPPTFGDFPERPAVADGWTLPPMPALPEIPKIGEVPELPEMPEFSGPRRSLPDLPPRPDAISSAWPSPAFDLDEIPSVPAELLSPEERQAERDAYRAARQKQIEERRAAIQAIAKQRRAIAEQRRLDWLCSRPVINRAAYTARADECAPADAQPGGDQAEAPSPQQPVTGTTAAPAPSASDAS